MYIYKPYRRKLNVNVLCTAFEPVMPRLICLVKKKSPFRYNRFPVCNVSIGLAVSCKYVVYWFVLTCGQLVLYKGRSLLLVLREISRLYWMLCCAAEKKLYKL